MGSSFCQLCVRRVESLSIRGAEELHRVDVAFCWDWVRFSGGVLIHILNMLSSNKAGGADNIPRT